MSKNGFDRMSSKLVTNTTHKRYQSLNFCNEACVQGQACIHVIRYMLHSSVISAVRL